MHQRRASKRNGIPAASAYSPSAASARTRRTARPDGTSGTGSPAPSPRPLACGCDHDPGRAASGTPCGPTRSNAGRRAEGAGRGVGWHARRMRRCAAPEGFVQERWTSRRVRAWRAEKRQRSARGWGPPLPAQRVPLRCARFAAARRASGARALCGRGRGRVWLAAVRKAQCAEGGDWGGRGRRAGHRGVQLGEERRVGRLEQRNVDGAARPHVAVLPRDALRVVLQRVGRALLAGEEGRRGGGWLKALPANVKIWRERRAPRAQASGQRAGAQARRRNRARARCRMDARPPHDPPQTLPRVTQPPSTNRFRPLSIPFSTQPVPSPLPFPPSHRPSLLLSRLIARSFARAPGRTARKHQAPSRAPPGLRQAEPASASSGKSAGG